MDMFNMSIEELIVFLEKYGDGKRNSEENIVFTKQDLECYTFYNEHTIELPADYIRFLEQTNGISDDYGYDEGDHSGMLSIQQVRDDDDDALCVVSFLRSKWDEEDTYDCPHGNSFYDPSRKCTASRECIGGFDKEFFSEYLVIGSYCTREMGFSTVLGVNADGEYVITDMPDLLCGYTRGTKNWKIWKGTGFVEAVLRFWFYGRNLQEYNQIYMNMKAEEKL